MPLTDTAIRNLKPSDKPQSVADERGLSIHILLALDEHASRRHGERRYSIVRDSTNRARTIAI